jgi:hypothetical protein
MHGAFSLQPEPLLGLSVSAGAPRLIEGTMRERHPGRFNYTSMSRLQSASSAIPSVRNTDIGSLTHRIPCYFFESVP